MRSLFVLFAVLFIYGCASGRGEWIPMTDVHDEKETFLDRYEVPKPGDVFEGIMFWEFSPHINEPPLSFRWNANVLTLWRPEDDRLERAEIHIDDCSGLSEELDRLLTSIGESAQMMTDDKVWAYVPMALDPTFYEIKYFLEDMMGSISLRAIDVDRVPWVPAAKNVVEVSKACSKN